VSNSTSLSLAVR